MASRTLNAEKHMSLVSPAHPEIDQTVGLSVSFRIYGVTGFRDVRPWQLNFAAPLILNTLGRARIKLQAAAAASCRCGGHDCEAGCRAEPP